MGTIIVLSWVGIVVIYAILRVSGVINAPVMAVEPITKESDYELFRKESVRNGF